MTTNCGIEPNKTIEYIPIVNDALKIANAPAIPKIVFNRRNLVETFQDDYYVDWEECVSEASPHDCVEVDANHPLYILYTSGTTGKATCILNIHILVNENCSSI